MSRFAIRAFVGPNGGGKTLAAVEDVAIPAWRRGRVVVANFELYPEALGFHESLYRPLVSWREIPLLQNCELILDEISSALPSRQAHSVPPELMRILNQLRKGDVRVTWTAPDWGRADVALRQVTQAVTLCLGSFPDRYDRIVPAKGRLFPKAARYGLDVDLPEPPPWVRDFPEADWSWRPPKHGDKVLVTEGWAPNRLFTLQTFDATVMDEFTLSGSKKLKPVSRRRYWRTRNRAMHAYSSLQPVDLLDHLDDVGTCVVCGGKRDRPKCRCKAETPQGASAPGGGRDQLASSTRGFRT